MVDTAITLDAPLNWILPIVFGLGTGLPILLIAWLISYSAISVQSLTDKLRKFEKWFRYICAILFISYGLYLGFHILHHDHDHEHVSLQAIHSQR